jgi:secondary thiamine-phosphate synthase enzyme
MNPTPAQGHFSFTLPAEFGHRDVTGEVAQFVTELGIETGIAVIQLVGSTGAITTIEYETGDAHYEHTARWGDGNGFSHIRSALLKTSISVPVVEGQLALGTWQQIVAINLDNRSRSRDVVVVVVGA